MTAPAPGGLYSKLVAIMGEVGHIEARGFNDFLRTKYVTEDDLFDAIRDKLVERGIIVLPSIGEITDRDTRTAKDKPTTVTTARFTFTFCDAETGETHTCEWAGRGEDPSDKGLSMASTQALRYFLQKTFFVSSGETPGGAPPPPRPDGQKPLAAEQYTQIVETWTSAGSDHDLLHGLLDAQNVKREIEGNELSLSQRVQLLSALEAINVLKGLAADTKAKVTA